MNDALAASVAAFVGLLCVGVLVSILAERFNVPAAVALVAAGIVARNAFGIGAPFELGPALLFVFLPPLMFEAAWNLDLAELRRQLPRIAALALPGTLFTAYAIAAVLALTGALPFAAALLFGAMIAATDPVAVIAVFRRIPVPAAIRTTVEGESIANDGVAVVLYASALALASGATSSVPALIAHGVAAIGGGIAIGAGCGVAVWRLLGRARLPEYEVTATVALAYVAYLAADRLGWSGIFACVSAAIALRALLRREARLTNGDDVERFWQSGAFIVNALVFLATGLHIESARALHEPAVIGIALAIVLGSRAVLALAGGRRIAERSVLFLAGMRGALPLALALALPKELAHRAEIIDAVFATVIVTTVVFGAPLQPVVAALYRSIEPARSS